MTSGYYNYIILKTMKLAILVLLATSPSQGQFMAAPAVCVDSDVALKATIFGSLKHAGTATQSKCLEF